MDKFFEKYEKSAFDAKVKTLASKMESTESIELAGRLVMANLVRLAGNLENYIHNVGHRLSKEVKSFLETNLETFSKLLVDTNELNYKDHDFFSASTIVKSYLLRPDYNEDPLETPCQMFLRIASHFFQPDVDRVTKAYHEMANRLYTQASPTLFNAGTTKSQTASCFLMTIGDSLDSILGTGIRDAGLISQYKGGLGIGLGKVRHSEIKNGGMSSGIVPICRILDKLVMYVDQGGKRAGAGTVYLPIWHIDIADFIKSTDNFGQSHALRLAQLNTAIWMHDLFMRRALSKKDETWMVFCPAKASSLIGLYGSEFESEYLRLEALAVERKKIFDAASEKYNDIKKQQIENPNEPDISIRLATALDEKREARKNIVDHRVYKAADLFRQICDTEIKSGFPYVMYGDSINAKSNQANIGVVNSSNLCTEITEVSTPETIASCNLASLNLKKYALKPVSRKMRKDESVDSYIKNVLRNSIDFELLGDATCSVVENLDASITRNYYPVPEKSEELNMSTRPLGIGVSGFDDIIKVLDLIFESPETEAVNKAIFACMYYHALKASVSLAKTHGSYAEFKTGSFKTLTDDLVHFGSPASNGFLQFDLWQDRANHLESRDLLDQKIYNRSDDIPVDPTSFSDNAETWNELKSRIRRDGLRNSLLLTVMPTASTAQILRNAESTEVHSSNIYTRAVMSGNYVVVNQHLVKDLEELNLWNKTTLDYLMAFGGTMKYFKKYLNDFLKIKVDDRDRLDYIVEKYKTMYEISQKTILKLARQRSIYIDQSQSQNIYLQDPSISQLKAVHMHGFKLGLKTGLYYLRQKSVSDENFSVSAPLVAFKQEVMKSEKTVLSSPEVVYSVPSPEAPFPVCRRDDAGCMSCSS